MKNLVIILLCIAWGTTSQLFLIHQDELNRVITACKKDIASMRVSMKAADKGIGLVK